MSQITHIMTATLSVAPGTAVTRAIDLPSGVTEAPNFYISKATVSDPSNVSLFKWDQLTTVSLSARDMFTGVNQFGIIYTLTGSSNVDVDFTFVWTDEDPAHLGYWEFD